jgi:PAS domain S-box-containing protein
MISKLTHENLEKRILSLEKELAGYKNHIATTRLNQQYLEAIINNTNLPIYLKDADYNYILINHQYERLAHVTNDQIQGKDDFAIFPEPVAQLFRSQDEEVVRRMSLVEFEETIPLPDGVHTFMTAKFPLIDSEGKVYAVGGVCTDITAYKNTEAELKEAEEKYRGIFEHSPLGILHINKEGIITASNKKFADILGSSVEKLIGFATIQSVENENVKSAIISALSGEIAHYEGEYLSVTGNTKVIIHAVFSPISSNEGSIIGAIGIIDDVTDRKNTQKALQNAHDKLEQRVIDRTVQLDQRSERLMETNVALKILLEKRDEDKKKLEEKVMFNVEKLIQPYLEKLKLRCDEDSQELLLNIIQSNLDEVTSSFAHNHKDHLSKLTPTQIQIADLIKQGQSTKEIAYLLNLSPSTIACHRQEIRKRLSLTNQKINLQAILASGSV